MFRLHPQLAADTVEVEDLPLSRVLLAKDSRYPWLILVPRRPGIEETFELERRDQQQLWLESTAVSEAMADWFRADKMNVAALGNQVPQLHIHHVARFITDAAWPQPIWGAMPAEPYTDSLLQQRRSEMKTMLAALILE